MTITADSIMGGNPTVARKEVYEYLQKNKIFTQDQKMRTLSTSEAAAKAMLGTAIFVAISSLALVLITNKALMLPATIGVVMGITGFVAMIIINDRKTEHLNEQIDAKEVAGILKSAKKALRAHRKVFQQPYKQLRAKEKLINTKV